MTDGYIGEIRLWPGVRCPNDWHYCDGSTLAISTYQALYSVIGTAYGGDGQTTFALPDLRNRVPIHQGQGTGLTLRPLASTGGSTTVTLTTAQIPPHTHTMMVSNASTQTYSTPQSNSSFASADPTLGLAFYGTIGHGETLNAIGPATIQNAGGNQEHNNVMPSQALNFIICLNGIYPSQN